MSTTANTNLVSVIIPTLNRDNTVKEAIESVLEQTYKTLEVLVIDDGSTDKTKEIVTKISDRRVKYFYQENSGPSSARNYGLSNTAGEYICFLDSDDIWPNDFLQKIIDNLKTRKDYTAAYAKVLCIQEDGKISRMSSNSRYKSGTMIKEFFEESPSLFPSAICYRSSVWENIFWDENIKGGEDYDIFVRISPKVKYLYINDTYIIKRWSPNNLSSKTSLSTTLNGAKTLERFYFQLGGNKYVKRSTAVKKISHRYRKAAKQFLVTGRRKAAIEILKRSIKLYPWDIRTYLYFLKAYLTNTKKDPEPNWVLTKFQTI